MTAPAGRHFLQIPGPTNVPDRLLRAIERPTIDHRGPEFGQLGERVLSGLREIFRTRGDVLIFPSSGTGAWEAALVNTLSPGDMVLMNETGHFSTLWTAMARRLGLGVEVLEGDWRTGADPARIEARLAEDRSRTIKAVAVVHNETSTGVTSRIGAVRAALDAAGHPALLLVDTISSLASIDYRHDEWGVDVTVGGSQKGLMLPPGLGFNAVSEKALAALEDGGDGALVLGLGGDARPERDRLLPLHPGDEPDLRARRGHRHAAGGRSGERVPAPRPPRRGDPARGARLGAGGVVQPARRVLVVAHRGSGAGGPQRRRAAAPPSSRPSTCRSATGSGGSPTGCSASGTSAPTTT